MLYSSEDLATYYAALKLPKSVIAEYTQLIQKWEEKSGIEWTISRCKEIYVDFVRYRSGLPLVGTSYKKNRAGLPAGIFSHIFRIAMQSKKQRFSCGVLLRSYTRHISTEVTPSQLKKWLSGVESPDIVIPDYITNGVCDSALSAVGQRWIKINQPSYISYSPSPGKRVPLLNGKTAPEGSHWFHQWETIDRTKTGRFLENKYSGIFSKVFAHVDRFKSSPDSGVLFGPRAYGIDSVGKIGLIQEPGFKLRAVANPNRVYQVALRPLGDAILDTLKEVPWDCTHDQTRAFPVIQAHLASKKRCHCVDLTGATDYFPLSIQLKVLNTVFPTLSEYISLFGDLSRSDWIFGDSTIKWTKGQPLGLYPSFGAFALTHGLLLYHLNGNSHNNEFFVLGDDVVILNDSLLVKYHEALKILECPVSLHKSISSNTLAEFGGKLISSDVVEPQLKWRLLSDDNFIDIIRLLGPKALRLLRPMQRKVAKAIMDIPDTCGGIGFNPHGLPFEVRYVKYLTLFDRDDGTFLMSYDRKFSQFYFNQTKSTDNVTFQNFWNSQTLPDLDQRSVALVSKYLPKFVNWYGIMGTNLYSVILKKDSLPIDGVAERRQTLLAQLQRRLSL